MAFDAKAKFRGLVTATAEATGEPSGLRIADNVVLRKEGALMCRPVLTTSALSLQYETAFPYKGSLFFARASGAVYNAAQAAVVMNATDSTRYGLTTRPPLRADIPIAAKESRGNLYMATARGVLKLTGISSEAYGAGIPVMVSVPTAVAIAGGTTLLAANQRVAYRIVQKVTDANGLIVRSRPTGATIVDSGGVAGSPSLSIKAAYFTDRTTEVEIYRTRIFPSTATVDDEFQLVATATPSSGGSPNVTFVDRVADTARGTTLYTSPSRGGMENAADRPPGCACIERYRGSLFFGNTRGPGRITYSFKWGGNVTGSATGIGYRNVTASWTNGSSTMTVDNATGLQAGMVFSPTAPPAYSAGNPGIIASIAGTTLTMTAPADNTRAGAAGKFFDVIQWTAPSGATSFAGYPMPTGASGGGYGNAIQFYLSSYTDISSYDISPPSPGYDFTTVVEAVPRGASSFGMRATHGDELSPPLALTTASYQAATYDDLPNGLAWSEPDEPEHVPPKNFARVGDTGKAILGLVATRDRLLIFKEDGLFMLTGNTARDFAIYPLDTTCLCILPGSIRRLQNTVYVLTNLGLAAVDESGGVTIVSRPIQNEVARIVSAIRVAQRSSGLYNMPGLTGTTAAADEANGEYWLALGSSAPTFGGHVLVYSLPRDGFTTFTFTTAPVCLATDGEGGPLMLTASTLGTPTTLAGVFGVVAARVSPRGFCDPALLGKLWTHIVAGFSELTGTTDVQARFTSAESMSTSPIVTEAFDLPTSGGLIQFPNGSLIRHPMPRAVARAYMLVVELLINVSSGTFTLESIAAESRENIPNKKPTHGTGVT